MMSMNELFFYEQLKIFCFVINNRLNNSLCRVFFLCCLTMESARVPLDSALRCNYKVYISSFSFLYTFNCIACASQPFSNPSIRNASIQNAPTAIKWSNKFKLFALRCALFQTFNFFSSLQRWKLNDLSTLKLKCIVKRRRLKENNIMMKQIKSLTTW